MNVGKLIAQGRQAKEMSQKDLATKICEKPQVAAILVNSIVLLYPRCLRGKYLIAHLIELYPVCSEFLPIKRFVGHDKPLISRWSLNTRVGKQSPTSRSWRRWREPLVWFSSKTVENWIFTQKCSSRLYIATQAWNCEARIRASPWKQRPQVLLSNVYPLSIHPSGASGGKKK